MSAKKRKGGLALDAICAKLKTQRLQIGDSPEDSTSPEDFAEDVAPQVSEEDVHVNGVASPNPALDQEDTSQNDDDQDCNSRTADNDSLEHKQSSLDSQQDCAMQDGKADSPPTIGNDSAPELASSTSDDAALTQEEEQPEDLSVNKNDQTLDLANDLIEQKPEESSRRKRTPNKITHFQVEEELSDDCFDGDVVIVQPTGCSDSEDEIDDTTEFENPFNQSDEEDQDDEDYDPEKDNINKRASSNNNTRTEPQVATNPVASTNIHNKATVESKAEQTTNSEPQVSQGDASSLRDYAETTMNELIGMFGYDSSDHDLKALPLQTFSSGKILEMQIKERQGNGLQNEALALVQGLTGATIDGRGSKYDFFIQKLKSGENFADPNDTITAGTISPRRASKFDPERIKYLQPQDISPILANLNEPVKKGGRPLKYDVRNFQGFNAAANNVNASPQTVTSTITTSDLHSNTNNSSGGDADLFDGELARTANASTDYIKACFSENGKPDVEEMLRNNEMNIFQKYIAKFSANVHCGHLHCVYQYKEHFHCLDNECNYQRFTNKQDVIRHYNMHKKKDNSLQHGFMRFSPLDDCSVYYSGCSLNLKHTHYHCMQVGCNKVYTSTSDVMTHENFHKKNAAFISEGFQRFRATEDCGIITCSFYGQKTTHFHCRRPNCNFSFKNKCDIEKHKAYHIKDDMYTKEGFKKFYKYEECRFDGCVYSKASNHFHCIRPGCGFTFTSTGQMHSHRRKHERRELRNLRDNKYAPGIHVPQPAPVVPVPTPQQQPPALTTAANQNPPITPSPAALQAAKLAKMPEATDVQEAKSGPVISASLARMAAAALSPSSKVTATSPTPSNSLPQFAVPSEENPSVQVKKEKEEDDDCDSSGGSLKLKIKQEDTTSGSQLMSMDGVDLSDSLNLTANFATLANPRATAGQEVDLGGSLNLNLPGVEEGDNARSLDTWEKFLKRYTANDPCDPRCEFLYKDHYHCVVEGCGAIFRSKEGVNKHAKYHRLSEGMIQNGFERFSQSQDCQKYDPNCQLRLKESHYHCTWPGCTHAVQMLTPNNQHYEQHKMMITPPSEIKPVPGSSLSSLPSGSQVDGIPGMRRFTLQENCGYPECYYSMKSSHYHCTKDGCLLAYVQAHAAANHPNMHDNSSSPTNLSEHSLSPTPEGLQFFNKYHNAKDFFCYYGIKRLCPDQQCEYRLRGHYHCNKPGCHFTTVGTSKLPWHLKKHDKAEQREAQGYKFFTKRESCGRLGCKYSLKSSHFHCIRPGCKFNFQFKHQMVTHSRKHMRRLFGRNFEQVLKANGEAAMESVISSTPPGQPPQNAVSSLILKKPLLQSSASSSAATPVPILPMTSLPQTILLSPPANPMQVALTSPPQVITTGAAAQMAIPVNLTVNTSNVAQASPTSSTPVVPSAPLAIPQLAIISQPPSLAQAGTSLPTLMVTQPTTTLAGLAGQPQLLSQVQQTQQQLQLQAQALQLAQQIQKAGLVTPTLLTQQTVAPPTLTSPSSLSPTPLFSSFSVPLTPLDSESSQPPSAPNTPGGSNDSASNDSGTLHQLPTNRNPFSSFEFRVKKRRSRMIDDGTMLEGFARYDLYEDCKDPKCQFSMRVTHYHCTRPNCGYKFCGRTHMYKHSQHHDRVDSLVLDDFQRYKSSVSCGRDGCMFSEKSTHFHCLRCDFQCTDSTKVTAHRKHHSKNDTVQAAGFKQFGSGVSCEQEGCRYNMKCSHFHCMHEGCRHVVVGMSQMESHKRKHTKHSLSMAVPATV
ncbi:Zinc finger protein castor 1 [Branchiostoma belcheri]|nr:Zinc finger protein castor 1 [Branchiostoma belcheri]